MHKNVQCPANNITRQKMEKICRYCREETRGPIAGRQMARLGKTACVQVRLRRFTGMGKVPKRKEKKESNLLFQVFTPTRI